MFAVPDLSEVAHGWTVAIDELRTIGDDLRIVGRPSRVAAPEGRGET
jgi:hypothetical protein